MIKKVVIFVGKGGVGKSTMTVECAQMLSTHHKVAMISLDQQQNIGDIVKSCGYELEWYGSTPKIGLICNQMIQYSFMAKFQEYIPLFAPDLLILANLAEILQQLQQDPLTYDYVLVDMPPNTQALYMLHLSNNMASMSIKFLMMRNNLRRTFTGSDPALDAVDYLQKTICDMAETIIRAEFCMVTIPAELGLIEAQKGMDFLTTNGYSVHRLLINMIPEYNPACGICDQRWEKSMQYLKLLQQEGQSRQIPVIQIPFVITAEELRAHLAHQWEIQTHPLPLTPLLTVPVGKNKQFHFL